MAASRPQQLSVSCCQYTINGWVSKCCGVWGFGLILFGWVCKCCFYKIIALYYFVAIRNWMFWKEGDLSRSKCQHAAVDTSNAALYRTFLWPSRLIQQSKTSSCPPVCATHKSPHSACCNVDAILKSVARPSANADLVGANWPLRIFDNLKSAFTPPPLNIDWEQAIVAVRLA